MDNTATATPEALRARPPVRKRGRHIGLIVLAVIVVAIAALIWLWSWDWFRPLAESRASIALGRRVTMTHFDLKLSRHPTVIADGVEIANPDGFPEAPYFAHLDRIAVTADAMAYWHGRNIVIDRIVATKPQVNALQHDDGRATWDFPAFASARPAPNATPTKPVRVDALTIAGGAAHVVIPKAKADFQIAVATQAFDAAKPPAGEVAGVKAPEASAPAVSTTPPATSSTDPAKPDQLVADAKGTYAGQPIMAHALGGALLSLRDAATPYAINATAENGPTKLELSGTVQDPLHFTGTDLKLHLTGPNMGLLFPLTGIPIPKTPPYDIAGRFDYAAGKVRFTDFAGRLGSSDIGGSITEDPGPQRPVVDATLTSKNVDLADLGGFVGSEPGRTTTPDQTPEQRAAVRKAEASSQLLPNVPINLPRFTAADVHLDYTGEHIEGRSVPFDAIAVKLDIVEGNFDIHPATLRVGRGSIAINSTLAPAGRGELKTKTDIAFDHVDVGRMLAATHAVDGAGLLGGRAELNSTGDSLSSLVGNGDGGIKLMMSGGNLSALLVDLSGLEFGNALLSALGVPNRAHLDCLVMDLGLRRGVLNSNAMIVSTSEADVLGTGDVDLGREALNLRFRTEARHLSIGSVPTDIDIKGTFKKPSIEPNVGELAARGGAAIVLGVLLTPLGALLPTVQFGTGGENEGTCAAFLHASGKRTTTSSAASPPATINPVAPPAPGKAAEPAKKPGGGFFDGIF